MFEVPAVRFVIDVLWEKVKPVAVALLVMYLIFAALSWTYAVKLMDIEGGAEGIEIMTVSLVITWLFVFSLELVEFRSAGWLKYVKDVANFLDFLVLILVLTSMFLGAFKREWAIKKLMSLNE